MSCPHGNWGDCDQCAEIDALYVHIGKLQAQRDALAEALTYAVKQIPELATVPGVAAAISKATDSKP